MKNRLSNIRKKIRTRDNGPAVDTMRKLGINYKTIHGLTIAEIKSISEPYLLQHDLAIELWKWDNREFKILATFIEDPKEVSIEQLELWGEDLQNSELAEQLAINLAFNTGRSDAIIPVWFKSKSQFARKAGVVLLAWMAQRSNKISDAFLSKQVHELVNLIDDNLQLTKGISFAIRAIGKRNISLNKEAIIILNRLKEQDDKNSKYIVEDALWELESDIIQERLSLG